MSTSVSLLKEQAFLKEGGNEDFREGRYSDAVAKYEAAISSLNRGEAQLRLVLLTNRLNASIKSGDFKDTARLEVLQFMREYGVQNLERDFHKHKLCKAFYHLSLAEEYRGDLPRASVMLRACLHYEPKNKDVLSAISRLEHSALEKAEGLGAFQIKTAEVLSKTGSNCTTGHMFVIAHRIAYCS